MRIFVAGATGAIGRFLVPLLVDAGHQVTGTSRTETGDRTLRDHGAVPVRLDVFDPAAVRNVAAPQPRASSVGGVRALEDAVAGVERHVILRYGVLNGPGTGTGGPAWARGASNTLARQKLAWTPTYPSWRTGFTSLS
jgi:uncharacterized protein YbjT (DUF2867 family)